jgi:hypothetical protein
LLLRRRRRRLGRCTLSRPIITLCGQSGDGGAVLGAKRVAVTLERHTLRRLELVEHKNKNIQRNKLNKKGEQKLI